MQDNVEPGVFLERRSYRRRRLRDGLRLLPFVGAWVFLLPVLWAAGGDADAGNAPAMSRALMYVFGGWSLLIAISAALQWGIDRHGGPKSDTALRPGTPDGEGPAQ